MTIDRIDNMTLSKAIRKVKTIKGEIAQARERASMTVVHKKADAVAWNFAVEQDRSTSLAADLCILQAAIARTNALTKVTWQGREMTLALAVRILAEIKSEIAWYASLVVRAAMITNTTHYENQYNDDGKLIVKTVVEEIFCHLTEVERARAVETLKANFEELNDIVETANHRTTLHDERSVSND